MNISDILFLFFWLCLPIFWILFLKKISLSILNPTIPSLTIAFVILYQYIGLPILYFELDEYRAEFIADKESVVRIFILTSVNISLMLIGMLIAYKQFGSLKWDSILQLSPIQLTTKTITKLVLLGVICICTLLLYFSTIGFDNIALFNALNFVDNISASEARSLMGNAFEGKYHWYQFFMQHCLSFVFFSILAEYLFHSSRKLIVYIILFGIALVLSLLSATEKAPIVNFVIAIILIFAYVRLYGKLSIAKSIKYLLFTILFFATLSLTISNPADLQKNIFLVFSRLTTGSIQPAYFYLDFFPLHHDWLYGRSLPNPAGILPFTPFMLTIEIMNHMHYGDIATSVIGSAPTIFWAELYANFGYIGVVFGSLLAGYFLYLINFYSFKFNYNAITLSFYVWLLMHYKDLSITGFGNFLIDLNLTLLLIIVIIVKPKHKIIIK